MVAYSVAHTKSKLPLLPQYHQSLESCAVHEITLELQLKIVSLTNSEINMSARRTLCHLQQSRVTWPQEIAGQIRARSLHHMAAAAFAAWSHTAAASIAAKLSMQQAIGRMAHLHAAQVFAAWQLHAQEQRVKTAQLGKAMARLQWLRCSAVVFAWHRLTLQKKAVQGRLAKAVR